MSAMLPQDLSSSDPKLSGVDKTTALLLTLDKTVADRIIKQLDNGEIKKIARAAASLGKVGQSLLDALIDELSDNMDVGMELVGSPDEAERLITGILPDEQTEDIMLDVYGDPTKAVWSRLFRAPEAAIAKCLANEHPQVGAFVLSKFAPGLAASIIAQVPGDTRIEVARRMLSMKPVAEGAERVLIQHINANWLSKMTTNTGPGIHAKMANILNKLERDKMDEVLKNLEEHNPKETEIVRSLLFTFEDIIKLTPENRGKLFDEITPDRVILALKGTDGPLLEAILNAVSSRARRMIEQELRSGAKVSKKDVMQARRSIAEFALELNEKGQIELHPDDDEEDDEM